MTTSVNNQLSFPQQTTTAGGLALTALAARRMAKGNITSGSRLTILGTMVAGLGMTGHSETVRNDLIKTSVCFGTLSVALEGIANCGLGIYDRNREQIRSGITQMATGLAGTYLISNLSSHSAALLNQAISVIIVSHDIATDGSQDIGNGNVVKGLVKMAAAMSGLLLSGIAMGTEIPFLLGQGRS